MLKKFRLYCFFALLMVLINTSFSFGEEAENVFSVFEAKVKDHRKNIWELTETIWNFGIIAGCDKGLSKTPIEFFESEPKFSKKNYCKIKSGDVVWLKATFVPDFYREVLPIITEPFVLVISDGDESFPSECGLNEEEIAHFIDNPKIIKIFAQNCDYRGRSHKVCHLPIGLDFHTIGYKSIHGGWGEKGSPLEQEAHLKRILNRLPPTTERIKRAYVDFQLSDTMHASLNRFLQCGEDRKEIFQKLLKTGLIDYGGRMKRSRLWKKKGQYAFSISPHGNGLDCHRTWEDLVLGCIVIVKASPLDPLYEGLPVVIVQDWSEVTDENLKKWLEHFGDAFNNLKYRSKLTNQYWLSKIRFFAAPYK